MEPIPVNERNDFVSAYYKRLTGSDEAEQLRCAKAWSTWEMAMLQLKVRPDTQRSKFSRKFDFLVWRTESNVFKDPVLSSRINLRLNPFSEKN